MYCHVLGIRVQLISIVGTAPTLWEQERISPFFPTGFIFRLFHVPSDGFEMLSAGSVFASPAGILLPMADGWSCMWRPRFRNSRNTWSVLLWFCIVQTSATSTLQRVLPHDGPSSNFLKEWKHQRKHLQVPCIVGPRRPDPSKRKTLRKTWLMLWCLLAVMQWCRSFAGCRGPTLMEMLNMDLERQVLGMPPPWQLRRAVYVLRIAREYVYLWVSQCLTVPCIVFSMCNLALFCALWQEPTHDAVLV